MGVRDSVDEFTKIPLLQNSLPTHKLFELSILQQEMLQKAIAEAAREVTTHVILIYKLMNHYQNVKGQAELAINYKLLSDNF